MFLPHSAYASQSSASEHAGHDWQYNFFDSATEIMEKTTFFHEYILLPVIIGITIFVFLLMVWLVLRYREKDNPVPSKTTHNTPLEVAWTIIPFVILLFILNFSIDVLVFQDKEPPADVTVKAIGYQWYWGYEYPQNEVPEYTATMLCPQTPDGVDGFDEKCVNDLRARDIPHKLATDYSMVVPVNKNVRVLITSMDVIHAWTIPAFGVKRDAVPGRMNSIWFNARKEGVFYGQCSELCGTAHAFMPIMVKVVSEDIYAAWLKLMQDGEIDAAEEIVTAYLDSRNNRFYSEESAKDQKLTDISHIKDNVKSMKLSSNSKLPHKTADMGAL
ncbi:MAG: cytochrome c oxidase subunit II [Pseudomonadota bacterium]